jgi:hypothetical protein
MMMRCFPIGRAGWVPECEALPPGDAAGSPVGNTRGDCLERTIDIISIVAKEGGACTLAQMAKCGRFAGPVPWNKLLPDRWEAP